MQQQMKDKMMNTGNPCVDGVMCVCCCCCNAAKTAVETCSKTFGDMSAPYPIPAAARRTRVFAAVTLGMSVLATLLGLFYFCPRTVRWEISPTLRDATHLLLCGGVSALSQPLLFTSLWMMFAGGVRFADRYLRHRV